MKFVVFGFYGSYVIEAKDFEEAVAIAYNNHTGYDDVYGIIKIPEE